MTVHTEAAFESSIEGHLLTHGWSKLDPTAYSRPHGLFPTDLIEFITTSQPKEWEQLQVRLGGPDAAASKIVQRVASELNARGPIDVMRGVVKLNGITFRVCAFKPANALTPALVERYEANRLGVVRQLHHSESRPGDSLDVTLVVNGIPTATAELKNPMTQQTVADAMRQYRVDRNPADLIFAHRTVVHFAVDPHTVYMTTRLAGDATFFLPFNQGSNGAGRTGGAGNPDNPHGYATAYLWEQIWQRDTWIDLIGSFVHAEGDRILFPRFHQWHAVRSLVGATLRDGAGHDRLVQHSAGSGKSNTIAWTAHALSRLHASDNTPIFDKVVIITDRVVLDRQLQETVSGLDHTPGTIERIDKHSSQLRDALAGHTARIIITTLQKFPVIAQIAAEVAGSTFAVLIDEAHSSTSGDAMKQLRSVLGTGTGTTDGGDDDEPDATDVVLASAAARGRQDNLSFFAFTATPKPKTLNTFGENSTRDDGTEVFVPFHLYSMRQAIDEGFILDVLGNYTTYANYYKLATTAPDDPDVPVSKAKAAIAKYVSLHPSNVAQKAEIVVEHFRAKTAGKIDGHAKAMVVTRSRLHAVRYHEAIQAYIKRQGYDRGPRPVRSIVAFSGSVTEPDTPQVSYTEAMLNGFSESQLPKRFATDEFQVLVVAEKYQTGFDQPLLHTMYVDKKLSGVKAVQTLSRLNRVHRGKDDTFVLDFSNTTDEIQDAFRPFFETTIATVTDPNDLYTLERRLMNVHILHTEEMDTAVTALLSNDPGQQKVVYAAVDPAVRRFVDLNEDAQDDFRTMLTTYVRAYAFVAQVMAWTDRDLERLFLYGKVLALQLPKREGEPLPPISNDVALTHLRTAATAEEANLALTEGTDEPGEAYPGGGAGQQHDEPVDKLSALIASVNERFGLDLTDADKLYFEQQKASVMEDEVLRVVALNNDRDQYRQVLDHRAAELVAERHAANGVLFDKFFTNPEFARVFVEYLAESYEEFRAGEKGPSH